RRARSLLASRPDWIKRFPPHVHAFMVPRLHAASHASASAHGPLPRDPSACAAVASAITIHKLRVMTFDPRPAVSDHTPERGDRSGPARVCQSTSSFSPRSPRSRHRRRHAISAYQGTLVAQRDDTTFLPPVIVFVVGAAGIEPATCSV